MIVLPNIGRIELSSTVKPKSALLRKLNPPDIGPRVPIPPMNESIRTSKVLSSEIASPNMNGMSRIGVPVPLKSKDAKVPEAFDALIIVVGTTVQDAGNVEVP